MDELPILHPAIAATVSNLALNLIQQGRRSEAQPYLLAALEIREKTLPALHPAIAISLNNLAGNLAAQNKTAEAFEVFKRSADLAIAALGEGQHDRIYAVGAMAAYGLRLDDRLALASSYLRDAERGALMRLSDGAFDDSDQTDFSGIGPFSSPVWRWRGVWRKSLKISGFVSYSPAPISQSWNWRTARVSSAPGRHTNQ